MKYSKLVAKFLTNNCHHTRFPLPPKKIGQTPYCVTSLVMVNDSVLYCNKC